MPAVAVSLAPLAVLITALQPAYGLPPPSTASTQGHATLSDAFRDVERLTEDTQHQLGEAVKRMDNESIINSIHSSQGLPPTDHSEPVSDGKVGNLSVYTVEKVDKVTDNDTDTTQFSRTLIQATIHKKQAHHECQIDGDCGTDHYCLYEVFRSQCLPCKIAQETCTKDEECCGAQLCVWGQCAENATKGMAGSICQYQSDCSAELCCAFHQALLFPVCSTRLLEHQHCRTHSNHLVAQLSWDSREVRREQEGPLDVCPCAAGLWCQSLGRGSVCIEHQNLSSEEDLTESLYSEIDYII